MAIVGVLFVAVCIFKLNVMDLYLSDSPSRWKLWEKGVSYYNYYTGESLTAGRKEIERMRREEKCPSETGESANN